MENIYKVCLLGILKHPIMCGQWEAMIGVKSLNLVSHSLNSHIYFHLFTQHPDGESDSPYVLLTGNPLQLKVKLQVSGKHKICE